METAEQIVKAMQERDEACGEQTKLSVNRCADFASCNGPFGPRASKEAIATYLEARGYKYPGPWDTLYQSQEEADAEWSKFNNEYNKLHK